MLDMRINLYNYKDVRPFIETGDLLLWSTKDPLSYAIQKVTDSPYSHVSMARWDHKRLLHFEANWSGTSYLPVTRTLKKFPASEVSVFRVRPEIRKKIPQEDLLSEALRLLDIRYGYLHLLRVAWNTLTEKKFQGFMEDSKNLICSSYMARVFKTSTGVPVFGNRMDYVTPGDIAKSPHTEKRFVFTYNAPIKTVMLTTVEV